MLVSNPFPRHVGKGIVEHGPSSLESGLGIVSGRLGVIIVVVAKGAVELDLGLLRVELEAKSNQMNRIRLKDPLCQAFSAAKTIQFSSGFDSLLEITKIATKNTIETDLLSQTKPKCYNIYPRVILKHFFLFLSYGTWN